MVYQDSYSSMLVPTCACAGACAFPCDMEVGWGMSGGQEADSSGKKSWKHNGVDKNKEKTVLCTCWKCHNEAHHFVFQTKKKKKKST